MLVCLAIVALLAFLIHSINKIRKVQKSDHKVCEAMKTILKHKGKESSLDINIEIPSDGTTTTGATKISYGKHDVND